MSVNDAVNMGLHGTLQHHDSPGTLCKDLVCRLQSGIQHHHPEVLHSKLYQVTVPAPMSQWITNFLIDRRQQVRLTKLTSSTQTISSGVPQGHVLSPLLLSLYTNDCTSGDPSVKVCKGHNGQWTLPIWWQIYIYSIPSTLSRITILNNTWSAVETFRFLDPSSLSA